MPTHADYLPDFRMETQERSSLRLWEMEIEGLLIYLKRNSEVSASNCVEFPAFSDHSID
jgi:hypothetical protein